MSVVSSVLIPIIKLWLRSQVEHIDTLEIEIAGKSRQILSGDIPKANVIGAGARYQGLAVTNIDLCAEAIHLNITQILKGDALRLLDPIRVTIDVELSPEDLQSCLKSPIFIDAITINSVMNLHCMNWRSLMVAQNVVGNLRLPPPKRRKAEMTPSALLTFQLSIL